MSGNGGDNAHKNAFGGGKNPGIGNSGSGHHSGTGNSGNSESGANVGHGGSMSVDLGNGMTVTFEGVHSLSTGEGSGVPWGGGSGHGNNGGNGNGSGNGGKSQHQFSVETHQMVQSGKLPSGYWLSNGKVMTKVRQERTSGGGKGNDRTYTVTVDREVPSFTAAYNEGIRLRQEAVARAQAEARARALAEEEARAIASGKSKAEFDAGKRVETAQTAVNSAQSRVNSLGGSVSAANQSIVQKQTEIAALNSTLVTDQGRERQTRRFANDPVQSRIFFNARAAMVRTQNAISSKQNEINAAVANRDNLNGQLSQANNALQHAKNEKAAADAALSAATSQRHQAEAASLAAAKAAEDARVAAEDARSLQDTIKFTADFYKELTEKFSDKASVLAQNFAAKTQGKTIRSVDEALAAFEKYKNVIDKKYNVADREAIANALMSVDRAQMAASLAKFSKAFGYLGISIDIYDVFAVELPKAIISNNWRPFFVKLEALVAGKVATGAVVLAFSIMTGTAVGVLGFALIMALVSSFIDENVMEDINNLIGV